MTDSDKELSDMIDEGEEQPPRQRYKSTLGDADKRKVTTKINIAKARQAKLDKRKKRVEEESMEYDIASESEEDYDDESDSEPEPPKKKYQSKPTKKWPVPKANPYETQVKSLEATIARMKKAKKKSQSRPIKKTVIQLPNYAQAPSNIGGKLKGLLLDL